MRFAIQSTLLFPSLRYGVMGHVECSVLEFLSL